MAKTNIELSRIEKNDFVKNVIQNMATIAEKYPIKTNDIDNFIKGRSPNKRSLAEYEIYNVNIFYRLKNILDSLDDLRNVQIFLRQYPTPLKNKISRANYIIYHMEVYFIKVASLRDKLAFLVNDIYELGLPDKYVKIDLIREMKQLKDTRIASILKKFSSALDKISKERNQIVHQRRYDNRELTKIQLYEMIEDDMNKAYIQKKIRTKVYIGELIETLRKNQSNIEYYLDIIFKILLPEFKRRTELYNA